MTVMVLEGVTLILQRLACRIFALPPCPTTPHAVHDGALVDPQLGHPAAVLDLVSADLPGLKTIASHVRIRFLERDLLDTPTPVDKTRGAVMPGLDVRGMGTQTVFGDDALEVRVVLAQRGHKPFGGMPFAIVLGRASVFHERFGHPGDHVTNIRMDAGGAQQLMRIGERPVPVDLVETRGTVKGLRRHIPGAIARHSSMASKERHRFERVASLQRPEDALEHGTERCWRPLGATIDMANPSRRTSYRARQRGDYRLNVDEKPAPRSR